MIAEISKKCRLMLAILCLIVSSLTPMAASLDRNMDRPGSDFRNFDLTDPDPDLCASACDSDPECKSFSYNPPGMSGPNAMCWLKNRVPELVNATGVVSGVKNESMGKIVSRLRKLADSATLSKTKPVSPNDGQPESTPANAVMKWNLCANAFCPEVVDPRVHGYAEMSFPMVFLDDGTWGELKAINHDSLAKLRGTWKRDGDDFWMHDDKLGRDYHASWSEEEMRGRWTSHDGDGCWYMDRIT
jgi:hypothetical protein